MNKKKNYVAPATEVVSMDTTAAILAGSGNTNSRTIEPSDDESENQLESASWDF